MTTQQTDRELLELAAKAEGRELGYWCPTNNAFWCGEYWSPHTNDGDGARLEAALGIDVEWHNVGVRCAKLTGAWCDDIVARETYADHGGDKQAARRLASLRVAAEIGKAAP